MALENFKMFKKFGISFPFKILWLSYIIITKRAYSMYYIVSEIGNSSFQFDTFYIKTFQYKW